MIQWWITFAILALYALNVLWLAYLGNYWASGYWAGALWISICAMRALTLTPP